MKQYKVISLIRRCIKPDEYSLTGINLSCSEPEIYNQGSPDEYWAYLLSLKVDGRQKKQLVGSLHYRPYNHKVELHDLEINQLALGKHNRKRLEETIQESINNGVEDQLCKKICSQNK